MYAPKSPVPAYATKLPGLFNETGYQDPEGIHEVYRWTDNSRKVICEMICLEGESEGWYLPETKMCACGSGKPARCQSSEECG